MPLHIRPVAAGVALNVSVCQCCVTEYRKCGKNDYAFHDYSPLVKLKAPRMLWRFALSLRLVGTDIFKH